MDLGEDHQQRPKGATGLKQVMRWVNPMAHPTLVQEPTVGSHHLHLLTPHGRQAGLYHSPSLVQVDQEDHVIPEAGQPVGCGHGDDEGKDIIDEGVEGLQSRGRS